MIHYGTPDPNALTRSSPLSGGAGEVQGLAGVLRQKVIDVFGPEAGLLTDQEALQGSHCHVGPVHLQVHQQLLEHQQRLRQQGEVVLPGSRGQSQQHLEGKINPLVFTTCEVMLLITKSTLSQPLITGADVIFTIRLHKESCAHAVA